MKYFLSLTVIIFFTCINLFAQVTQQWAAVYNHLNSQDIAQGLAVDNSGNVYTIGSVINGVSQSDYALIKYNSAGTQQWIKLYNGAVGIADIGDDVALDNAGNIYVTGRSDAVSGNANCVTIKYNPAGDTLWVKRYDFGYCSKLLVDNSSNVYVVGRKGDASFSDYLIIKYNSAGTELWSNTYTSPGGYPDEATAVCIDSSGNVYITGYASTTPQNSIVTIKYNSSGVLQWTAVYSCAETGGDRANDICADNAGNIYITGYSDTLSSIGRTFITIKYNTSGLRQWVSRYYGGWLPQTTVNSRSMALYQNNAVYVTGYAVFNATYYDYVTVKYNSSGVQQWVSTFHTGTDLAAKVVLDDSGNAYVTGSASNPTFNNEDAVTVKYNSAGSQQWVARYNGTNNNIDEGRDIEVKDGSVYVAGRTVASNNLDDMLTIKYSQIVGIQVISNEMPSDYSLKQNYPNPFNPNTNIAFSITKAGNTKLVVYDLLGRVAAILADGYLAAGSYKVDFDASNLSSGVYFYRLTSGGFTETRKLTVIK